MAIGGTFDKDLHGGLKYELPGGTAATGLPGFPKV
jgi:hypothetical protein